MNDNINNKDKDQKIKIFRKPSKNSVRKHYYLKRQLNKPIHLTEYFLVIGINPIISINKYLYTTPPKELETTYKNEIYPEILTKFPPMNKNYTNIGNSLIDLCFPNGFHLEQYNIPPKNEIFHLLLDNSFYSTKYPYKYITCLKFYEDLSKYYNLYSVLKKELGNKVNDVLIKRNRSKSIDLFSYENDEDDDIFETGRASVAPSRLINDSLNKSQLNVISKYYFPKIICFVSIQPFFKEQEEILKQIYDYYINNYVEEKNIPIENIILNILCNIPLPPNGLSTFTYKISEKYNDIIIKNHKMNELKNREEYLIEIFKIFDPYTFIDIFKYIIFETKILVFSDNLDKLCYFIYGIISTLFPFEFPFQVSSAVPESAFELLESISPYILGINMEYYENFFQKYKIDIGDCKLIILNLDKKEYILKNVEDLPNIPKSLAKRLSDKIYNEMREKNNNKNIGEAFLDFFVNILCDYSDFLNNENLKKNYKINNLKVLFNIKNYVDSRSYSDKPFYNNLVKTQMFNDFIFKKMIPKDINDKLSILFFDENITKKNNKRLFAKQKNTIFLNSSDYEYEKENTIPIIKELAESEKLIIKEKNFRINNLFNGQQITISNDDTISFNYILFPKFNKQFFNIPSIKISSYSSTDINRINTELLAKCCGNNEFIIEDNEMQECIYLTYVVAWANTFWYLDRIEVEYRFEQLLEILEKINHYEIGILDSLFEALNKFDETEKIFKLYNFLLEHNVTPGNYIYSIVRKNKNKNKNTNNTQNINKNIIKKKDNLDLNYNDIRLFKKRTFHSEQDDLVIGDTIKFDCIQKCIECYKMIDVELISMDYKNMQKDILWAKCPECKQNIRPQLTVQLGNDFTNEYSFEKCSKIDKFNLNSPYEVKNNFREIISKEKCGIFDIVKFKKNFPKLFFNIIWYFKLNKIDYSIILPYESMVFKSKLAKSINFQNINSTIYNNSNQLKLDNFKTLNIKKPNNITNKKYSYNFLYIQNVYSFLYINNLFYENYKIYEISKNKCNNNFTEEEKLYTHKRIKTCKAFICSEAYINNDSINNNNNNIRESDDFYIVRGNTFETLQEISEINPSVLIGERMVSINSESKVKKDVGRSHSDA